MYDAQTEPAPPTDTAPKFDLGRVVRTPGALDTLNRHGISPLTLLARHVTGDFGDIDKDDWKANTAALQYGGRILSAYTIAPDVVSFGVYSPIEALHRDPKGEVAAKV